MATLDPAPSLCGTRRSVKAAEGEMALLKKLGIQR